MDPVLWKILMVDDDEDDYLITRMMLAEARQGRCELVWAATFEVGQNALKAGPFDVVLVDYDLGARNGIELIQEALAGGCSCPFILYTGRGSYEVDLEAMQAGASLYLTKGETSALMLERGIRYAIERKQNERALAAQQAQLEAILDAQQDIVLLYDTEMTALRVNRAFEDIYGFDPVGMNVRQIAERVACCTLDGEPLDWSRQPTPEALDGQKVNVAGFLVCRADGSQGAVETSSSPLRSGDQIIGSVTVWHDITGRKRAEEALEAARTQAINEKNLLEAVMEALPVGLAITNAEGGDLRANDAYRQVWGGPPLDGTQTVNDYEAYRAWQLETGEPIRPEDWASAQAVQQGKVVVGQLLEIQRFDGRKAYVLNSAAPVRNFVGKIVGSVVAIQDITSLWKTQAELVKLNRALRALSNSNQAVMRATDEASFLQEICQNIIGDCGYAMAWVGFAGQDEEKSIHPAAIAGFEEGYLKTWPLIWAEGGLGCYPTGSAIHTGRVCLSEDIRTDPAFLLWREQALQRGYAAFIALPLISGGKAFGALTIYAREPAPFKSEEVKLLTELASDLAYGIQELRLRAAKELADEQLRVTLSSIGDAVIAADRQGRITFINPVAERLTGWVSTGACGQPLERVFILVNEQTGQPAPTPVGKVLQNGETIALANHTALVAKDGRVIPIEDSAAPILNDQGEILGVVLVFHDVSEKRKMQARVEHLASFPQQNPNPVIEVDFSGQVIYYNEAARKVVGGFGKGDADIRAFIPEDFATLISQLAEQGAGQIDREVRLKDRVFIENIYLASAFNTVRIYAIDATRHKQVEEGQRDAQRRLALVMDSIADGFYTLDRSWRFTHVNDEALRYFRRAREDLLGRSIFDVFPNFAGSVFEREYCHAWESGLPAHFETPSVVTDRIVEMHVYPASDSLAVLFLDVTARKQAENRLQEYTDRLERLNQELQDFASVAGHDLQEPLRKLQVFGSRLQKTAVLRLAPEEQDTLSRMQDAAARMQAMLDNLLAYARVSTGPQSYSRINLSEVVVGVLSDLEVRIEQSQGKVEVGDLPTIEANPLQMRQLFQNLISNALKFSRTGVSPHIKIYCQPPQGTKPANKAIQILVEDNGIGFDMKHASKLFQPFQRLVGHQQYEGTGIGLAICRKIVERHQGCITVESTPGQGSKFTLTLPERQATRS